MRGVVAGDVADAVTGGGGALDELLAVLAPSVDASEGHGAPVALKNTLNCSIL